LALLREKQVETFEDLDLKEPLLRDIYAYGFTRPSPLQKLAIRPIIEGQDIIMQAKSGTGKTAACLIGSLQRMDADRQATQTLVLAPTRELACPIQKVAEALGTHLRVSSCALLGGNAHRDVIAMLRRSPQVVVGTPGRVRDMLQRREMQLDDLNTFVLDEADEMMARGFRGLILETMEMLPPHVQMTVFSATMPPHLLEYLQSAMRKPVFMEFPTEKLTMEGIRHLYVALEREEQKLDTLRDLLDEMPTVRPLVYCNTRRKVDYVAQQMAARGVEASSMHAELDREEREIVVRDFLSGTARVLISTDMMARSDLQQVRTIVNYDLPHNVEDYSHRVAVGGRFRASGVAVAFVTQFDERLLRELARAHHIEFEEAPADIAELI